MSDCFTAKAITEECKPYIELHEREVQYLRSELAQLEGYVSTLLEEVGALLPISTDGGPIQGSLCHCDREGIRYDGQLQKPLYSIRECTDRINPIQDNVQTAIVNVRAVRVNIVGERPTEPK